MGDCSSTQETVQPNIDFQAPSTEAQAIEFEPRKDHVCSAGNNYGYILEQPPVITDFSAMILKDVLTQQIQLDQDQKEAIFKNIEKLDFRDSNTFWSNLDY